MIIKYKIWKQTNQTIELVETLSDHFGAIYALKCLSNQKFISSFSDKTVRIWQKSEKNNFECIKTIYHDSQVVSLSFLNNLIISGESEGKINIWNESSFELISNFSGHNEGIWSLIWSTVFALTVSQDKYLISGSADGLIIIWNLINFNLIKTLKEQNNQVTGLTVLDKSNEYF